MYFYETLNDGRILRSTPFLDIDKGHKTLSKGDDLSRIGRFYYDTIYKAWTFISKTVYDSTSESYIVETIHCNDLGCLYIHHDIYSMDTYQELLDNNEWINPGDNGFIHHRENMMTCFNMISVILYKLTNNMDNYEDFSDVVFNTFFNPFVIRGNIKIITKFVVGRNIQMINANDIYIRFTEFLHRDGSNGRVVSEISFPIEDFLKENPLALRTYIYDEKPQFKWIQEDDYK